MAQANPPSKVHILENTVKRKEVNCTAKSTSDGTNGEKVHREIRNIEDLVKRKGISDTSNTNASNQTRSAIGNGKRGIGGGKVIRQ